MGGQSPSEVPAPLWPLPSSQALGRLLKWSSLPLRVPVSPCLCSPPGAHHPLCQKGGSGSPCSWREGPVPRGSGLYRGTECLSLWHHFSSPLSLLWCFTLHTCTHAYTRIGTCTHTCPPPQRFWRRHWAEARCGGGLETGEQASSSALSYAPSPGRPAICRSSEVAIWCGDLCSLRAGDRDEAGRHDGLCTCALGTCLRTDVREPRKGEKQAKPGANQRACPASSAGTPRVG